MQEFILRLLKSTLVVAILCGGLSCEHPRTTIVVKEGDPQQFIISGDGILDNFVIRGPIKKCEGNGSWTQGETPLPYMEVYWEIGPVEDFELRRFAELGPIIYGNVPNGFKQFNSKNGQAPPICEGGPYAVELSIRNGSGVGTSFIVREGKIETAPRGSD